MDIKVRKNIVSEAANFFGWKNLALCVDQNVDTVNQWAKTSGRKPTDKALLLIYNAFIMHSKKPPEELTFWAQGLLDIPNQIKSDN